MKAALVSIGLRGRHRIWTEWESTRPVLAGLRGLVRKLVASALAAACLLLWLFDTAGAGVGFVLYFKNFGDWTVLCWRDTYSKERTCNLSAPPASLNYKFPPNVIQVDEVSGNQFEVSISVRDEVVDGLPLYLRMIVSTFTRRRSRNDGGMVRR